MRKKNPLIRKNSHENIILAAGLLMLFLGIFLALRKFFDGNPDFLSSIFLLATGEFLLFCAFCFKKTTFLVALGFMFILDGIFCVILKMKIFSFGLRELWPCFVLSTGLSLIPADLFVNKRLRTIFLFPAILLVTMGGFFLLFSTHIFKFSFATFISMFWPLFFVILGIALISIYAFQQVKTKEFPYMQDDSADENSFSEML